MPIRWDLGQPRQATRDIGSKPKSEEPSQLLTVLCRRERAHTHRNQADHRLALHPGGISDIAIAIANALGAQLAQPKLPPAAERFVNASSRDLIAHKGRALVLAGEHSALKFTHLFIGSTPNSMVPWTLSSRSTAPRPANRPH